MTHLTSGGSTTFGGGEEGAVAWPARKISALRSGASWLPSAAGRRRPSAGAAPAPTRSKWKWPSIICAELDEGALQRAGGVVGALLGERLVVRAGRAARVGIADDPPLDALRLVRLGDVAARVGGVGLREALDDLEVLRVQRGLLRAEVDRRDVHRRGRGRHGRAGPALLLMALGLHRRAGQHAGQRRVPGVALEPQHDVLGLRGLGAFGGASLLRPARASLCAAIRLSGRAPERVHSRAVPQLTGEIAG